MYLFVYKHSSHQVDFDWQISSQYSDPISCTFIHLSHNDSFKHMTLYTTWNCHKRKSYIAVCERRLNVSHFQAVPVDMPDPPNDVSWPDYATLCSQGHRVLDFLACYNDSKCITDEDRCGRHAMFECATATVPFTVVCDYRDDCSDGEDEQLCFYDKYNCPITKKVTMAKTTFYCVYFRL